MLLTRTVSRKVENNKRRGKELATSRIICQQETGKIKRKKGINEKGKKWQYKREKQIIALKIFKYHNSSLFGRILDVLALSVRWILPSDFWSLGFPAVLYLCLFMCPLRALYCLSITWGFGLGSRWNEVGHLQACEVAIKNGWCGL
jgi:hypothetical protein